jgi:hypothetical protein
MKSLSDSVPIHKAEIKITAVNSAKPMVVFSTTGEYLNTAQLIIATNIVETIPDTTIRFVSILIIRSNI